VRPWKAASLAIVAIEQAALLTIGFGAVRGVDSREPLPEADVG
jgi:hypothetical protein